MVCPRFSKILVYLLNKVRSSWHGSNHQLRQRKGLNCVHTTKSTYVIPFQLFLRPVRMRRRSYQMNLNRYHRSTFIITAWGADAPKCITQNDPENTYKFNRVVLKCWQTPQGMGKSRYLLGRWNKVFTPFQLLPRSNGFFWN